MVNVLCLIWKNLHRAEKIYTGSARGARDKYEVWLRDEGDGGNGDIEAKCIKITHTGGRHGDGDGESICVSI